jgi:hypothetical protein
VGSRVQFDCALATPDPITSKLRNSTAKRKAFATCGPLKTGFPGPKSPRESNIDVSRSKQQTSVPRFSAQRKYIC